jgi:hypothetical protein
MSLGAMLPTTEETDVRSYKCRTVLQWPSMTGQHRVAFRTSAYPPVLDAIERGVDMGGVEVHLPNISRAADEVWFGVRVGSPTTRDAEKSAPHGSLGRALSLFGTVLFHTSVDAPF